MWIKILQSVVRCFQDIAFFLFFFYFSPDGKRHRSKGQLERYLQRNDLSYDANDFDFSVFGRTKKRSQPLELKESKESNLINNFKRRSKPTLPNNRPVPDLDISELKDIKFTPEGEMINAG